jgi:hypothetical protein
MAKKKASAAKAKVKAEKKARTAQKVEKKEKKKAGKSKLVDEEDDNQDLEGILDRVSFFFFFFSFSRWCVSCWLMCCVVVDEKGMGGGA